MKNLNFRSNKPQDFDDWGGKHQAIFAGVCVVCGTRVYQERDYHSDGTLGKPYDPDWRGVIGEHSVDTMRAAEYDKQGNDVLTCCVCANEEPRYKVALKIAMQQWH